MPQELPPEPIRPPIPPEMPPMRSPDDPLIPFPSDLPVNPPEWDPEPEGLV